jgi:isocitrate lyase
MAAYVELQEAEFAAESQGYTATRHQREVGTGYFDQLTQAISGGKSSLSALRVPPRRSSSTSRRVVEAP